MARPFSRLAEAARQLAAIASYEVAIEVVASRFRASPEDVRRRCPRRPGLINLKRQALYLAVIGGHSRRRIAAIAGLSHEAVAAACRAIEDARDDPQIDRVLDELELEASGS